LMVARSSLAIACSSVAIQVRNDCMGGSLGLAAMRGRLYRRHVRKFRLHA
jgi:hypothetical protein